MVDYEQRRIISTNLQRLIQQSGKDQKQIALELNVKPPTFNQWVKGKAIPKVSILYNLAEYFGVNIEAIIDENNKTSSVINERNSKIAEEFIENVLSRRVMRIPVLGRVAAGIPIEMVDNVIDTEELDPNEYKPGNYFGLKIKGNSMEPKIEDGDVIIVRQQDDVESGQFAVVAINGEDATCKRVMKQEDGIMLVSINPEYPPKFFSNAQIENLPVKILGKVVESRCKFE